MTTAPWVDIRARSRSFGPAWIGPLQDNTDGEETTPTGATNAQFDVSLDLTFG